MTVLDLDTLTPARAPESHPPGSVPLLNHGWVTLLDSMPAADGEADERIVWCARRSYQGGTRQTRTSEGLIRYLLTSGHLSPFEHVAATINAFLPLAIQNQWVRHRTGKYSILSLRYSVAEDVFYLPQYLRGQDAKNKQGSSGIIDAPELLSAIEEHHRDSIRLYNRLIERGVAREQARGVIGVDVFSDMVVSMDLRNLIHFTDLRHHEHAQPEIQVYAREVERMLVRLAPITMAVVAELKADGVRF